MGEDSSIDPSAEQDPGPGEGSVESEADAGEAAELSSETSEGTEEGAEDGSETSAGGPEQPSKGRDALVATARAIRAVLPGDRRYGDPGRTSGDELPQRLGRAMAEQQAEKPSALRELGLGALQAWEAITEDRLRTQGEADVAILFTDLVSFSDWALEAGDEAALELLRQVASAEETAISDHAGVLVKRLGDGAMAVFGDVPSAVHAALEASRLVAEVEVEGHRPQLRAGIHLGRPRKVGGDFLGVDINIAARVGDAAKGGEVLVSGTAREELPEDEFKLGRNRRLRAAGAPSDLTVCRVRERA